MTAEPDDLAWQVESRLTGQGIYVTDFERDDGIDLTYESMAVDESGRVPHRELGRVIQVLQDVFGEDWTGERVEATVTDLDGEVQARWHVRESWLSRLASDDLSEIEFSERVLDTLDTRDESDGDE